MSQITRGIFCALAISAAMASAAQAQTSGTRTSGFAYDAASGLLTQEVIEPGTPALRLQTDYVYDAFGNKTQATVSGTDIVTRSATVTYDAQGRFVVSATNALSQSDSRQFDARFGQPTSQTGPNGLTTTWIYDSFGRKTLEVRPDGTQTKWEYLFCSGVNGGTASCPTGGAYLMRGTPLASDGVTQNGPLGTVYFDRLDRDIFKDIQSFDGSLSRIATEYDSFGRVLRKSRPYFVSGGTLQWTVMTYDALGRVTVQTRPDSSTVQTAYHGLVITETNPLGQTRTTTKNSQGQVVSVIDAQSHTTTYVYDPFGNMIRTTDAVGNVVTATYDARGRKIASNDPNMGAWTYAYNTLDQLVSQVDAKIQTRTVTYDKLGRVVQRTEPDMTAVWTYDTAPNGIGKLVSTSITSGPEAGFQRAVSYDSLSRPVQVATTIDSQTYNIGVTYDAQGRQGTASYPSGFSVTYAYNSLGYVQQLKNTTTGQAYWTANARDAELHLTQQTSGNGVVTNRSFNAQTGRLTSITAGLGSGSAVESMSYSYDTLGNLLSRADANTGLSESFTYDPLNRLTSSTVGASLTKLFGYDAVGNLLSKSDVGNYTYPAPGQPRPHAVLGISGSIVNTTFTYDPNGNQTGGLNRTIGYTSYNKPNSITQGTRSVTFAHDMDHQRFKQVAPEATTLYLGGFGIFAELYTTSSGSRWNEYLVVGKTMIGVRFLFADETTNTRYFHQDHLGSIAVITNEAGAVIERNSHDSWGKRRFPNGTDDPTGTISSVTTQGYTGQEELTGFGLVHLNGRVYDPFVGRMMSADPTVPEPMNAQAWNRYSYVINNPLAFTDPSGYSWLSEAFHFVQNLFRSIPILGAIIKIAAVAWCGPGFFVCAITAAVISSAAVAGITTGKLGAALKAGIIAGATALAFYGVGEITGHSPTFLSPAHIANVAGHALVGCASSVASGGKCGSGALSAGITSFAAPGINNHNDFVGSLVRNTVLGGVASVAAGGKFENGAITGAFGYLFNFEGGTPPAQGIVATIVEGIGGGLARLVIGAGTLFAALVDPTEMGTDEALLPANDGLLRRDNPQYVVRGGTCTADRFCGGSGVTIDDDGSLQGVSVQSAPGASVQEMSQRQWVPQNQIGVTTVDRIEAAGGSVIPSPNDANPYHSTLFGITPETAQALFTPTIPNPNPRMK